MGRSDEFKSAFEPPPGHQWGHFGAPVELKPLKDIDIPGAIGEHWHGGKHQKTIRALTATEEYEGGMTMHHALVQTKDKHGATRHHVLNLESDGRLLNSREGDLAGLQRHMDNLEHGTDHPTGGYFDPLPRGYTDKYGKAN